MRRLLLVAATVALLAASPAAPVIVTPSQLHWQSSSDLPAGGKIAVVDGDVTKAGWCRCTITRMRNT